MALSTVNYQLVELALRDVDGASFERFGQTLMAALRGADFVPVGGTKDGGADGYITDGLFEEERVGNFLQISIQADYSGKVRHTVGRLKEVGRAVRSITYLTSQNIQSPDLAEDALQDLLEVKVRVFDQKYITAHINNSQQTIEAFNTYLSPFLAYLSQIGGATTLQFSKDMPVRALCVFLGQEVERRSGNTELLESVTDGLVLWALEGTDPDKGIFKTKQEILTTVEAALPAAKKFIRGNIGDRLRALTSKDGSEGRRIRYYKKEDKYCLPYETRELVLRENEEDELLKLSVSQIFRSRLADKVENADPITIFDTVVETCHRALQITFETQGIEMAHFVLGDAQEDYVSPTIAEYVRRAVEEAQMTGRLADRVMSLSLTVLRGTFYSSSQEERLFLGKLSRTYILLFLLKNEPKIVDYFRGMTKEFVIYVGSDIVVRALSEFFLQKDDQMTNNTFAILKAAGSRLILSEKCLDEVWSHLKVTDMEYINHYKKIDSSVTLEIAREIDRILIRSYYYAKLDPDGVGKRPTSWPNYISSFCDYGDLHGWKGREALKGYLVERYGFEFETDNEMMVGIDPAELEELAVKIVDEKHRSRNTVEKEKLLARNDALHVLKVYAKRNELKERARNNPYGYKTWWLTQENSVRRATGDLVRRHGGFYMMRPEFLLHFIGLSPSESAVRNSFFNVFPTLLGVRLSNRLPADTFKKTIDRIGEVFDADEPRAKAMMQQLSNELKGNFDKHYDE